jgi:hypothetical protein
MKHMVRHLKNCRIAVGPEVFGPADAEQKQPSSTRITCDWQSDTVRCRNSELRHIQIQPAPAMGAAEKQRKNMCVLTSLIKFGLHHRQYILTGSDPYLIIFQKKTLPQNHCTLALLHVRTYNSIRSKLEDVFTFLNT